MPTAADLISEAKRHLQSFQRDPMNRVATAVTATAGTVTFEFDTTAIQPGAHLQVGLELMYVWAIDPSSKTATVQRAQLGSVATTHAVGAVAVVNPKFPDFAIFKAINDELADLSSPVNGLYVVREVTLTSTTNSAGYDLPGAAGLLEIIDIRMKHPGMPRTWSTVSNYEINRAVSTTDFPSGVELRLSEGTTAGQPIRVQYKTGFTPLTNLTDDVEVVGGLPRRMQDIPPMGAAVRLVAPREIKRNFTEAQGDSRRAAEVPPGAVSSSMRMVAAQRQNRITAEAALLAQQYPDRGFLPLQPSVW